MTAGRREPPTGRPRTGDRVLPDDPDDPRSTDEDLLAAIRAGRREWFGPLVRRYERELYGYLRRYLGDEELAADVFQNTFVAVFRKIHQYEPGRAARPWLYAIATNQAIDALRHRKRRGDARTDQLLPGESHGYDARPLYEILLSDAPGPSELAEAAELRESVRAAVDRLPDTLRQVVVLSYFQGLKHQEIAEAMGIPLGTVKSRLHTALAKLSELWQAEERSVRGE